MQYRPHRTGNTKLTDDQLVLLDVLFNVSVPIEALQHETFQEFWNMPYGHTLDDAALTCEMQGLVDQGVLEKEDGRRFRMTPAGGTLWSEERCPVWERYCRSGRWTQIGRGRARQTVIAVSPRVRDDFLALWPEGPIRQRLAVIADPPLLRWRNFPRVYVGVLTYGERGELASTELPAQLDRYNQGMAVRERERSWWFDVPQLQRFVPKDSEPQS